MAVVAVFSYAVQPGRMDDFLAKLARAASPEFDSPVMPTSVRLFHGEATALEAGDIRLAIEYVDMAAYAARSAFEQASPAWRDLFEAKPDSPERLVSVELLTELALGPR